MKTLTCTATAPGSFIEGVQYPVKDEDAGTWVLIDMGGRTHFVRKGREFAQTHFKGAAV